MNTIISGVAIKVISGIILAVLGIGGIRKVVHVHTTRSSGTVWKLLVILGYILFYGAGFYALSWSIAEGFKDKAVIGLAYCMLGFVMLGIGRLALFFKR